MQYIAIIDVSQLLHQTRSRVLDEMAANAIHMSYLTAWYRWALNHILHSQFNLDITGYEDVAAFRNVYNQVEHQFSGQFLSCVSSREISSLPADLTFQTAFTGQELLIVSCKDV